MVCVGIIYFRFKRKKGKMCYKRIMTTYGCDERNAGKT